ncbi:hypothetical protein FB565_006711 [Actinoplanes lutulentus]|uniref:DUF5666 domain-containing protein n=1 Tax=Actinoplanes lutulentus TaxID=1287878 RepID=A0A327Z3Y1_9ACTN|nr:hypothetical protein [Actinoplanes lutulentus]MBB2946943.1 hypothetical protein [Actinoplanes lutulentus]RAK30445.1 hypothetical protein B0I29_116104 [Actinoplanes lutulentus]
MRMRRTAVAVAMTVAVVVPAVSTGVVAYAQAGSSPSTGQVVAAKKPTATPTKSSGKKVKATFSATGTVTAVDAAKGTVTVAVKGGTKDVKGRTVTIGVPSSVRILLNGKKVAVSALAAGNKITVAGTRIDAAYTATKVQASGKAKPTPRPSVTPTTPAPSTAPSATPSAEPTESEDPEADETP